MILQSLHALYDRLKDDPAYEIAPPGYSLQKIAFTIVLRPDGSLFEIEDSRIEGRPRQVRVPGSNKPPGSGINPCFLWDNSGYMLGYKPDDPKPERTKKTFEAFRERHLAVESEIRTPEFSAVCRFLESWVPENAGDVQLLRELKSGFGLFRIRGETTYVHENPRVDAWWHRSLVEDQPESPERECLLTGRMGRIARLQPMLRNVAGGGAQSSLVGFNDPSFESYGKEQAFNAPVGEDAAFEYGTALNALLDGRMKFKHRMLLGDSTIAFWTDRPCPTEDIFARFADRGAEIDTVTESQDEGLRRKLEVFLEALRHGIEKHAELGKDLDARHFYVLALSPNQGRAAVRFFLHGTIRQLLDNLRRHFGDMGIERQYGRTSKRPDPEFPPAWLLLRQTARESKEVPPILAAPLMRAILTGTRYSDSLYGAVLRRIHADRVVNYPRASIIKGCLVRNNRQEVSMSLDTERNDPAYRLGRLFAVLEKAQEDALGRVNASVRDRFYGAASATPRSVFPRLLRTYQHHLGKLDGGLKIAREKLVQEIVAPITDFPAHFNLAEQGLFALGYYHQRQAFFKKLDADKQE